MLLSHAPRGGKRAREKEKKNWRALEKKRKWQDTKEEKDTRRERNIYRK